MDPDFKKRTGRVKLRISYGKKSSLVWLFFIVDVLQKSITFKRDLQLEKLTVLHRRPKSILFLKKTNGGSSSKGICFRTFISDKKVLLSITSLYWFPEGWLIDLLCRYCVLNCLSESLYLAPVIHVAPLPRRLPVLSLHSLQQRPHVLPAHPPIHQSTSVSNNQSIG